MSLQARTAQQAENGAAGQEGAAGQDGGYWPTVATLTGGAAVAPPPEGGALKAFDAAFDLLTRRSTVTFRRPAPEIDHVTLQMEAAGGSISLDVPLPAAAGTAPQTPLVVGQGSGGARPWMWVTGGLVLLAALLLAALVGARSVGATRRSRRPPSSRPVPETLEVPVAESPPEPSLFEKADEPSRHDHEHRHDLVTEYLRLAQHDRAEGRLALAASGYRQAVDLLDELSALEPGEPAHLHDLAVAVAQLAELDIEQGWTEQAAAGYRRAVEIGERLVRSVPGNGAYRHYLDHARSQAAAQAVTPNDPNRAP